MYNCLPSKQSSLSIVGLTPADQAKVSQPTGKNPPFDTSSWALVVTECGAKPGISN